MVAITQKEIKESDSSLFGEGYELRVDFDMDILIESHSHLKNRFINALNDFPAKSLHERVTRDCPHLNRRYITMWFPEESLANEAYARLEEIAADTTD